MEKINVVEHYLAGKNISKDFSDYLANAIGELKENCHDPSFDLGFMFGKLLIEVDKSVSNKNLEMLNSEISEFEIFLFNYIKSTTTDKNIIEYLQNRIQQISST